MSGRRKGETFAETVMRQVRWLDRAGKWATDCRVAGHVYAVDDVTIEGKVWWIRRCAHCGRGSMVEATYPMEEAA